MSFKSKLLDAAGKNNSWLCVGLDTDPAKLPSSMAKDPDAVLKFNEAVIEATSDLVCAYKPNIAFYEIMGACGWEILKRTIESIPSHIPVIVDAKRGDIGNTAGMYARAIFEHLNADAVTVNPYLGRDSVEPFIEYVDKGTIILCLTSNKSSSDIQKQLIILDNPPEVGPMTPQAKARTFAEFFRTSTTTLYEYIAGLALDWNENNNIGLVVGATAPKELSRIRDIIGDDIPILIPGVGAQGGDLENSVVHGSNTKGELAIINVARGVIYSWEDGSDFQTGVRKAAQSYREQIADAISLKATSDK